MKKGFTLICMLALALNICACGGSGGDAAVGDSSTASLYAIQGTVTANGAALADATIILSGDKNRTTTTDDNGSYTFSDLTAGSYVVTPNIDTGFAYDPGSVSVQVSNADVTGRDFMATRISAAVYLHYYLPDQYNYELDGGLVADEAAALFSGYALTDRILYSGNADDSDAIYVSGYALDQFVDEDRVYVWTPDPDGLLGANDPRTLYAVVVRSNQDGFTNRSKFVSNGYYNPDLGWGTFSQGYLLDLNYTGKTFFQEALGLVKMYNVKYAYDLYLFRKIDVQRPDAAGTIVTFEPQATTDNYVDDTVYMDTTTLSTTKFTVADRSFGQYTAVKTISLDQFLTAYVTDRPSDYTYRIVALDGTTREGWTYAEMQQACYLPDYDFIVQVDAADTVVADTRVDFPVRIELVTSDGSTVEYDYTTADPPAYTFAYDE